MPITPSGSPFPRKGRKPAQVQQPDEHRINERIRIPEVRLIDADGAQVGIVQTSKALALARERGLDLVELSPTSKPPVCKILDYGKFKYEKKKKEQIAKKKQVTIKVKEVQFRPHTDEHDLQFKFRSVKGFLENGDKAKITMFFRGRQIAFVEQGKKIMERLIKEMEDISSVESPPKREGRRMIMILAPTKPKTAKSKEKPAAQDKAPQSKESQTKTPQNREPKNGESQNQAFESNGQ